VHEDVGRIDAEVRALLAERLHIAPNDMPAGDGTSLLDLGLDSTAILSLVVGLEEAFDVEIPDRDITLDNFGAVDSIGRYLAARLAS
jgi:acyl carrier protein